MSIITSRLIHKFFCVIFNNMKIEELFRLTRELQGKKQTDIAYQVGITRPALSNLESSRSTLSISTLLKIAPLLCINPEFVIDQTKNPFQSKELIKMFFNEKVTYYAVKSSITEPLNVLIAFNDELKFISLISNFHLPPKISRLSLSPYPIYAVAVKDQDNNIFLLRRKANIAFVKLDGHLCMDIWPITEVFGDQKKLRSMWFAYWEIDKELHRKIEDWTVERADIEPLFSQCDFRATLSGLAMQVKDIFM